MKQPTVWDPFRELEDMSHRLNRVFGDRGRTIGLDSRESLAAADWSPAVDIEETTDHYILKVELPEVDKKDVSVTLDEGVLSIRGERKQEKETHDRRVHRVERVYGNFIRRFTLPDDVDPDGVRAEHKNGMLYVKLHKSPAISPQAIEVEVE